MSTPHRLDVHQHVVPRAMSVFGRPRAFDTIVYGGLLVGVLDAVEMTRP